MHSHEAQVQSYLPFFEEKGVFKSLFPQIPVKNNPQDLFTTRQKSSAGVEPQRSLSVWIASGLEDGT